MNLSIFITFLMFLTLAVVVFGVVRLASGKLSAADKKKNNNLMFLRVALQAIVIMILAFVYFLKK